MLDIPTVLEHHKDKLIGNYPLNLLEIRAISNLEQYHGELKALFGFLKYQNSKQDLQTFILSLKITHFFAVSMKKPLRQSLS